ncbi:MAG: hypothetical protein D6701_08170, partial [Gemmatimonadetes bacterium]
LDAKDRFALNAAGCYAALRDVVDRVRQAADVWSGCCQCLAAAGCAPSASQCALGLAEGKANAASRSCVKDSCEGTCRPVLLLTAPPARATTLGAPTTSPPASGTVDL